MNRTSLEFAVYKSLRQFTTASKKFLLDLFAKFHVDAFIFWLLRLFPLSESKFFFITLVVIAFLQAVEIVFEFWALHEWLLKDLLLFQVNVGLTVYRGFTSYKTPHFVSDVLVRNCVWAILNKSWVAEVCIFWSNHHRGWSHSNDSAINFKRFHLHNCISVVYCTDSLTFENWIYAVIAPSGRGQPACSFLLLGLWVADMGVRLCSVNNPWHQKQS